MTLNEILVLVLTRLTPGSLGFWVARKSASRPEEIVHNTPLALDIYDVKRYVDSLNAFAVQITPTWAAHIETSRQEMEQAVNDLTQRFAGITASLDATLNASDTSLTTGNGDVFLASQKRLQRGRSFARSGAAGEFAALERKPG